MPLKDDIALYVHWPWCKKKCPYCDFNSHVHDDAPIDDYIDALLKDLSFQANQIGNRRLISIFFGGGTPSLMPPETVDKIIEHAGKYFSVSPNIEVTLEANPTSSGFEKFSSFKNYGVNRLSIGIQSLHDELLQFLGREHTADEARKTITAAKNVFDNMNVDFIYGLPKQKIESWLKDLDEIICYQTTHISCYQLTIEPQTAFHKQVRSGEWQPMNSDTQAIFFNQTRETLVSRKYSNYEISNFCLNSYACKHNHHIWQYGDYIGIGAGAHGRWFDHIKSHFSTRNYKMPKSYIEHVQKFGHALFEKVPTSIDERNLERLLLGLRLSDGILVDNFEKSSNLDFSSEKFLNLQKMNLIKIDKNAIRLTKDGWPFLDAILENMV